MLDEQKAQIRDAPRTNASPRKYGKSHYYDDEAIALVAERQKFIVDKFDYVYKP